MVEKEGSGLIPTDDYALQTRQGYQSPVLTTGGESYEVEFDFAEVRGAFEDVEKAPNGGLTQRNATQCERCEVDHVSPR